MLVQLILTALPFQIPLATCSARYQVNVMSALSPVTFSLSCFLWKALRMFKGEMVSLEAILQTNTVKVPKPLKVIELERAGSVLVMEHVDMKSLNKYATHPAFRKDGW